MMVILTKDERDRMEGTHQPGASIVKKLGADPTPVCMGCGMDWPCPGRRLLDAPQTITYEPDGVAPGDAGKTFCHGCRRFFAPNVVHNCTVTRFEFENLKRLVDSPHAQADTGE